MTFPADLPGADLVESGLRDLGAGRLTVEALLVAVGSPRLKAAGIEVPPLSQSGGNAELELYRMVAADHPEDAHAVYNGLLQRLVSFECALESIQTLTMGGGRR